MRWRGVECVYTDREVEFIADLIAAAERGDITAADAARQWDLLQELKLELDAVEAVAPDVADRVAPCPSPGRCFLEGCTGVCTSKLMQTDPREVEWKPQT